MASSIITRERFAAESFHAWETSGKTKLGQVITITGGSPQVILRSALTEFFSFGRAVSIAGLKY